MIKNLARKALTGILLLSPVLAFGQLTNPTTNITSLSAVESVITKIINWLTGIFFAVAVLYIFYAAFLYLTAAGEEEKIKKAKNQLLYSVIAIAVALLAGTMRYIIGDILR